MVKPILFFRGHSHGVSRAMSLVCVLFRKPDRQPLHLSGKRLALHWYTWPTSCRYSVAVDHQSINPKSRGEISLGVTRFNLQVLSLSNIPCDITLDQMLVIVFLWHTQETAGVCFRTLLVKLTGPYWFHYVSYRPREGNWVATCCNVCLEIKAIS